jgi:DNA-binding NtrC family response regulator
MGTDETILIIDDELTIAKFVQSSIHSEGKRVILASNGKEGLEHLKHNRVDVLFTDLQLPDGDGINLIRKALQIHPNIASVVITGFGSLDSAIEALRLGACDYITKPFSPEQIVRSLRRAIGAKQIDHSTAQLKSNDHPSQHFPLESFIARSVPMRKVISLITKISQVDMPVLIQGEVGVGKKTLARLIHNHSPFAEAPFTHINCSAIVSSEHLNNLGIGVLENLKQNWSSDRSHMGTIFLEDIEQLPKCEQKQLLNLLEEGCIRAPWSASSSASAVRLITSTTADLQLAVSQGQFHRSLYDNLNVLPINVPPLRERREDIVPLSTHLLEQLCNSWNCPVGECRRRMSNEVWELLLGYEWPGNVQELSSVISRMVLLEDSLIVAKQLKQTRQPVRSQSNEAISVPFLGDLKSMECHMISEVVKRCGGNKAEAARTLGMHRRTLYRILEKE